MVYLRLETQNNVNYIMSLYCEPDEKGNHLWSYNLAIFTFEKSLKF
jgi:hypothetical protein